MKLIIENLGIIKFAEIDLDKNLTILCGQNSTGKTYASYALHAFLEDGNIYQLQSMKDVIGQIVEKGCFSISKHYLKEWLDENCKAVVAQVGSIFGISEDTKNKLFPKFALSVDYTEEDFQLTVHSPLSAQLSDGVSFWKITKAPDCMEVYVESNVDNSVLASSNVLRAHMLVCYMMRRLAFCKMSNARMLTVERNSIYTFKTELSLSRNELVDQIQQNGKSEFDVIDIINKSSRRYPFAVRSSLKIANDLENVQKSSGAFVFVADMIEHDLLKGEVSMTKNGDVEFHPQGMAASRRLPFHLSSSIVKTMASLVIYLKHIANVGDTLIIDEPEMNFHPDVQIVLARIFALLTIKGLRVVLSTHSDYIIREINNLIMAGALVKRANNDLLEDIGYPVDMLLDYNNVSVLMFNRTGKNVVRVSSLEVDEEGFAVDSIDSAIRDQNIKAELLYGYLMDNK
ncbi:MAG: AAA family ATPase [Bacteroidales bacterium]|nr:AAA family ATPase [Candidatus Physcocola equi]